MSLAYQIAKILSILLFLYYGLGCLLSDAMIAEFRRFGLDRYRRLTGGLEVLGALALLVGYVFPVLVLVASSGLTVLMILGIATRIRVRDSLVQMIPAFGLMIVNMYIVVYAGGFVGRG